MTQATEYVARVRSGPAYAMLTVAAVVGLFYAAVIALLVRADRSEWYGPLAVTLAIAGLLQAGSLGWLGIRSLHLVGNPPRVDAHGISIWVRATGSYVVLPWSRVRSVRVVRSGSRRGLYVYVDDPEGLAGGDARARRRVRRHTDRLGTPFVAATLGGAAEIHAFNGAVTYFSGGRVGLTESPT